VRGPYADGRDYAEEAVGISRGCPGMGDPWAMTPAQWDMTLIMLHEQLAMESGDQDSQFAAGLSRVKRRKRNG